MLKFLLLIPFLALAQPPVKESDFQIQRSDVFSEDFPAYSVCKIEELEMIDDVSSPFTAGQCLVRNAGNTSWIGGACGTGAGSSLLDAVTGPFSAGQCLVRNTGNSAWIGGMCAVSQGGDGRFVSLATTPTDLSSYVPGQVLRINSPDPGKWLEITGANARHGFKWIGTADPNNSNNWGYSSFGDVFGELQTEEGGKLSTIYISRIELQNRSGTVTLTMTIPKSVVSYANAPASLYLRVYQGAIGSSNYILGSLNMGRATDNQAHDYITYLSPVGDGAPQQFWTDRQYIQSFRIFTSDPGIRDDTDNNYNFHASKGTREIDPPGGGALEVVTALPTTNIDTDKIYYLSADDPPNHPGFFRREGASWARISGLHLSESYLRVSETQRILGFGTNRVIDKNSDWTTNWRYTSGLSHRLSDGSNLITGYFYSGSYQPTDYKWFKMVFNSDKTDVTMTEITLDTGVTLPANWSYNTHILKMPDGKFFVRNNTNQDLFIVEFNTSATKIKSFRKLGHQMLQLGRTQSYQNYNIFNYGNDILFLYGSAGTHYESSGRYYGPVYRMDLLSIGESTERNITIKTGTLYVSSRRIDSQNNQSTNFTNIIVGTNYSYIMYYYYQYYYTNSAWTTFYNPGFLKIPNTGLSTSYTTASAAGNDRTLKGSLLGLKLADGSFLSYYQPKRFTWTQNEINSPRAQSSEIPTVTETDLFTAGTYLNDYSTQSSATYNLDVGQDSAGDVFFLRYRTLYSGGTSTTGYRTDGLYFLPVNGDIQTTVDRVLHSDEISQAISNIIKTPRRVQALPADSASKVGEDVYLEADYSKENGFDITPQPFANTSIDGEGYGNRGWYSDPAQSYSIGRAYPRGPPTIYLISDTVVLTADGQEVDLTHILYGSTECTLTLTDQTNEAVSGSDQRNVDSYAIQSGCVPSGDWDDVRFKKNNNTYIPASVTIEAGQYQFQNNDWIPSDFRGPELDPGKDFKILAEEERHGTKTNKNLAFVVSGSTFTVTSPFPKIIRLTYNNSSSDTDTYQRYTVFVDLEGGSPSHVPTTLQIGTKNYSFSYYETDAGQAVYRTPKVQDADRISAAGTINSVNIKFDDDSWAGQTGATKALRIITNEALQGLANAVQSVATPPATPTEGQRIQMLEDYTLQGGAVLTAEEASTGNYTGWEDSSVLNDHAELGSVVPKKVSDWLGLISFSDNQANNALRNRTAWVFPLGKKPTTVWINQVAYTCGATRAGQYCQPGSLDGSFIKNGERLLVNALIGGQKLYPDVTLSAGQKYIWDGLQWIDDYDEDHVIQTIKNNVQDWAENPQTKDYIPADEICAQLTGAQHTALSPALSDRIYCIPKTSQ